MKKKPMAGGYIDSYCTRCKLNLGHTIIAMIDEKVARVKCGTCGSQHNYKDAAKEKAREVKMKSVSGTTVRKSALEKRWEAAVAGAAGEDIPYDMKRAFSVGDLVAHSTFGRGAVRSTAQKKMIVIFKDQERILVSGN
ncbi:MAG: hypothetical protein OEV28_09785 [Nitrospirota bacterium]|nr:hypothetical protein [Nitrospirota bacterium]